MSATGTLLVIDDDPGVVDFLVESLRERGYTVSGETDTGRALERLAARAVDLVITDAHMPGLHGTDVVTEILRRRPTQLVLLMTAFGSVDLALDAVRAGACDFIAKPFKIEALVFAVERAFRDRAMRREIVRLRAQLPGDGADPLVTRSPAMRTAIDRARRVASGDSTVLLTGETGCGKGVLARVIHDTGPRRRRPFVQVNCASLPPALVESELFGVRRGAYTDAHADRPGAFAAAADGTLFLDEVGELALDVQAKLLHALENRVVRPLGGDDVAVRARVIAATNRPLEAALRQGTFRPDLYYRLNVIRIDVPPLRDRRDDLVPLVDALIARGAERAGRPVVGVSAAAMRRLAAYSWPGNVRELANVLERAIAFCEHDTLMPGDLDLPGTAGGDRGGLLPADDAVLPLDDVERAYVARVLERHGGNKAEAARVLGINRRTLYRMLAREPRGGSAGGA